MTPLVPNRVKVAVPEPFRYLIFSVSGARWPKAEAAEQNERRKKVRRSGREEKGGLFKHAFRRHLNILVTHA